MARRSVTLSPRHIALALLVAASCRRPTGATTQPGRSVDSTTPQRAAPEITPRTELLPHGPFGVGNAACMAMLYAWDPSVGHCRLQLNHCNRTEPGGLVACLSLADERDVPCDGSFDACGERVVCRCPRGAPEPVPDPPGVVVLHPPPDETHWQGVDSSGARCEARASEIPGTRDSGLPPLCVVAIRECDSDASCIERTQMEGCGVRSEICGRPVRCECR